MELELEMELEEVGMPSNTSAPGATRTLEGDNKSSNKATKSLLN